MTLTVWSEERRVTDMAQEEEEYSGDEWSVSYTLNYNIIIMTLS